MLISLRDLARELFDVENMCLQSILHDPGKKSEVYATQQRMRVLGKIRDHRESGFEIPLDADSEAAFRKSVDKIAFVVPVDLESETTAVNHLIRSLGPATETPVSEQRAAE